MKLQSFGRTFKMLRTELGFTQEQLIDDINKRTGISLTKGAISQYENDRRIPEIKLLEELADYFKVTVDFLLARSEKRHEKNEFVTIENDSDIQYIKIALDAKASGISPEKLKALVEFLK